MKNLRYYPDITLDLVKETLIPHLEASGHTVELTEYNSWTQVKVIKEKNYENIDFNHNDYKVGGHFIYKGNRKLKDMKKLYTKVVQNIDSNIAYSVKADAGRRKLKDATRMLETFGFTEDNSRIYGYDAYISLKTDLNNVHQNEKIGYRYGMEETLDFMLYNDGTSKYTIKTKEIDLDNMSKIKTVVDDIQNAWELSTL